MPAMFRYGDKVVIRDGTVLEGCQGLVYGVKDGQVMVLLDREVLWEVPERRLERWCGSEAEVRHGSESSNCPESNLA